MNLIRIFADQNKSFYCLRMILDLSNRNTKKEWLALGRKTCINLGRVHEELLGANNILFTDLAGGSRCALSKFIDLYRVCRPIKQ